MRIDLDKKISFRPISDCLLLMFLPIICVGGVSYFPYMFREVMIYSTAIISLMYMVVADSKIKVNAVNVLFFLFLVYVTLSLTYSYDRSATMNLLIIYACAFPLLFMEQTDKFYVKILEAFRIIAVIIAISILISVPINDCMNRFFWPIVNPSRSPIVAAALRKELADGLYSGFAREKGEAAYIMNIGIASCLSIFFTKGKLNLKETVSLVLMIAALLLSGKRMMLIVAFACFCVLMLLVRMKGKAGKVVMITIVGALALFFALMFFPHLANTFIRFTDNENIQSFGRRDVLWKYSYMMIDQFFVFGAGLGTYNNFAYDNGLRSMNGKWEYYGHNVYYEALGEIGIVGCVVLFGFFLVALIKTLSYIRNRFLKEKSLRIIIFSFYVQLMMLIYCVTGNPLYTEQIIITWIFSIGMAMTIVSKNPIPREKEKL